VAVNLYAFLTSEPVQIHAMDALPQGEEPFDSCWLRDWVDPRSGLYVVAMRNISFPPRKTNPVVHHVVSHFTYRSVPAN
jgi:hypothetical protein